MLSPLEARVLGCLLEKARCTPEYYPLTLNSLVAACNQRSNRDPVMEVGSSEVEAALDLLRGQKLAARFAGAEARVSKYKHTFENVYPVEPVAEAILAELLLRGPQTTAELRQRAARMVPVPELAEVEAVLETLSTREVEPLVQRLPRLPGQKEQRWVQLLTGAPDPAALAAAPAPVTVSVAMTLPPEVAQRLTALETEVAFLRDQLAELKRALGVG